MDRRMAIVVRISAELDTPDVVEGDPQIAAAQISFELDVAGNVEPVDFDLGAIFVDEGGLKVDRRVNDVPPTRAPHPKQQGRSAEQHGEQSSRSSRSTSHHSSSAALGFDP